MFHSINMIQINMSQELQKSLVDLYSLLKETKYFHDADMMKRLKKISTSNAITEDKIQFLKDNSFYTFEILETFRLEFLHANWSINDQILQSMLFHLPSTNTDAEIPPPAKSHEPICKS